MARIRTIKPEFFTSDDICALSPRARLLYIGLWCEADREGRLVWAPRGFKRRYLPDDECDVDALCKELTDRTLVRLYGDGLAFIPTFATHQHVNPREAASKLAPPPPSLHAPSRVVDASLPVDDSSFACAVVSSGGEGSLGAPVGSVVRWHMTVEKVEYQAAMLDSDVEQYVRSVAEELDVAALRANIRDSQQQGQHYRDFTARAMNGGVQGYYAFLRGRRVTYFGRTGDQHTEWFPGAGPKAD